MEDGIWRTVSGRKIFIKDGQSLGEAMRSSGKFKSKESTSFKSKTKEEELAELNEKLSNTKGLKPRQAIRDEINRVNEGFTKEEWEAGEREAFKERENNKKQDYQKRVDDAKKLRESLEKERIDRLQTVTQDDILREPQEIRNILKENDIKTTKNIDHAIYMFTDGTMVDGEFSSGQRGTDHNALKSLVDDRNFKKIEGVDDWVALHMNTNVIRLVPETKSALIMKGQELTGTQISKLKKAGYEVMEYVEKPKEIRING